jgi:hypothetical protein
MACRTRGAWTITATIAIASGKPLCGVKGRSTRSCVDPLSTIFTMTGARIADLDIQGPPAGSSDQRVC